CEDRWIRGSSPRMTISSKPRACLERRTAQKVRRFHRLPTAALQFEDPDRAVATGDCEVVVEHSAGHTGTLRRFAAQDLEARRFAVDRDLAPGARERRQAVDVP